MLGCTILTSDFHDMLWYTIGMKDLKRLKKQIKADEAKKTAPAEKPLKITNPKGFHDTIKKIVATNP